MRDDYIEDLLKSKWQEDINRKEAEKKAREAAEKKSK